MVLVFTKHDPFFGLNAGFVALCVNTAVTVTASLCTPAQPDGFEELEEQANAVTAGN